MVLVDTSVWIRFLAGREPHASGLDELLATDEVLSHDLIEGGLLVGAGGAARRELLAAYAQIHRARTVPHGEVVEFVMTRKLHGRGLGWIDAHLLASTLVERCTLWTADNDLADVASELHVMHAATR
jgi:predicted nucleic acid-binding protein